MGSLGRMLAIMLMLVGLVAKAQAAEIRMLSVDAVAPAARNLAAAFAQETDHRVLLTVASPAAVVQKIKAGEIYDAVIISEPAMDRLDQDGLVNPESRVRLASGGIGVALPADAARSDPLPPEAGSMSAPPLQAATVYEGALMSDGDVPEAARAFIHFLASPDAREHWLAARLEPLP